MNRFQSHKDVLSGRPIVSLRVSYLCYMLSCGISNVTRVVTTQLIILEPPRGVIKIIFNPGYFKIDDKERIPILTTRLHFIAIVIAVPAIIAHEHRLYAFAVIAPEHAIPAAIACNRKHSAWRDRPRSNIAAVIGERFNACRRRIAIVSRCNRRIELEGRIPRLARANPQTQWTFAHFVTSIVRGYHKIPEGNWTSSYGKKPQLKFESRNVAEYA